MTAASRASLCCLLCLASANADASQAAGKQLAAWLAAVGSGFEVRRYNAARVVGHGGGWYGVTNHVDLYPDLGYTFVVLSNYDVDTTGVIPNVQFKVREWLTQGRP